MSTYYYTPNNRYIKLRTDAWIDNEDVDATIVYGIRNTDGTAIASGTASVSVTSMTPIEYTDELDMSGLSLTEGKRYDIYAELQVERVAPSPTGNPGIQNAYLQNLSLSVTVNDIFDKIFAFRSAVAGGDIVYFAGGYELAGSNNDFSPSITFGSANISYGLHFFVVLGETAVDEITITITGTSITDAGTRTTSDTETITIPDTTVANTYYETTKRWLGQITIETTAGTAKNCNYGYVDYWDNGNADFQVIDVEFSWFGGANDSNTNLMLYHHKKTGWTYNAGARPTPPTPLADMDTVHSTDDSVAVGVVGAFKKTGISQDVDVSENEGIILACESSVANSILTGNAVVRIRN
jgi:hypothetical protein